MNQSQLETCYVILHLASGPSQADVKAGARVIVEEGDARRYFTNDIWMERLDKELAKKIQSACEPRHFNTLTLPVLIEPPVQLCTHETWVVLHEKRQGAG